MANQQLIKWIKSQENQGYSEQQIYNSLIQQGYNPNEVSEAIKNAFQSNQPTSEPMKKTFNILSILIIGIVVIGLIGGGILFFTFQDDKTDSDIEDDPIAQHECGMSESLDSDIPINQINYETDDTLVCLGNSLLNECKPSKAILDTFNAGKINFEIKNNEDCTVRMEYGGIEQISSIAQKQYANKYIECPLDIDQLKSQSEQNPSEKPGTFAFSVYFYIGIESMNPNTKCEGTLLESQDIKISNETKEDSENENTSSEDITIDFEPDKISDVSFMNYHKLKHYSGVSFKPIFYNSIATYFTDGDSLYRLKNNVMEKLNIDNIINFRNKKSTEMDLIAKAFDPVLYDYINTDSVNYYLFAAGIIKEEDQELKFIEKDHMFGEEIIIANEDLWLLNSPTGGVDKILQYSEGNWIDHDKDYFLGYEADDEKIYVNDFESVLFFEDEEWQVFYEYQYPEYHFIQDFVLHQDSFIILDKRELYIYDKQNKPGMNDGFDLSNYLLTGPDDIFKDSTSLWLFDSDTNELIQFI
ncbi:MAG: hypothetical protein U9P70_00520 [Patescibacteria group bacterium]|nr:hypothetical protein [Patescibacteria group bacterium]